MITQNKYNVIGIMSGTSMDGIDCSYVRTDGVNFVSMINENSYEYSQNYRNKLKKIIKYIHNIKSFKKKQQIKNFENIVTNKFIQVIKKFIKDYDIKRSSIDYIGVSGHTVLHDPKNKKTIQLGSCKEIQKELKIKIVGNFRENDIKNSGQGSPIGAFYHQYILNNYSSLAAIINLGGIANICYSHKRELIAFDLGPANVLIDDLMHHFYKKNYDKYGTKAIKGKLDKKIIDFYKKDNFFKLNYPKSLDREYFKKYFIQLKKLKNINAIHTASMMTIVCIDLGLKLIKKKINELIITGGGRKNLFLINVLKKQFKKKGINIVLIDNLNFNGDLLEAQAFAYLTVRSIRKLPLSLPTTTGVKKPTLGGALYK
ncbi:MAG: anhydro-N-acetylmuramic acid kinase [Pelagibacteraceae bacterium]|jgi:anhydro-N-acetylmuramic acid kinase|nr:anhydro-N-acetylmuramic acid kinase [Pelagibacteraceae bacterium]HJO13247.1 anhydro-N-acetylmuramic acid kinase [Alphaproteobacteria bacterium]MBO6467712.1 anhydro-N-acetylmuramic acid kinase [Pelagibacteraceae bacterium]MBO6469442.1 anhydro-N-acetylmuramic acid kinase [Pelagibacteraceae bacterium]MBO6471128.1 anhydro-N-acetylmuramic acid kinase [Pelagibacteraceae bacterium]|tara:strand:- start:1358 stop:2470 length:1113 start_codon:yes stop_codon:yes gene_type:complete